MTLSDTSIQTGLTGLNFKISPYTLKDIHECNRTCVACHLSATRNQVVPGVGSSKAKIVLVGEAPGEAEDVEGVPFFGRCGKLLTKLLRRAMIEREDCYITNAVCCRPPHNKLSKDEQEINSCKMWLWQKLKVIQPKVIVTLGKVPTRLLLSTKKTIKLGDYVGKEFKFPYHGFNAIVIPSWHPSYLLQHGKVFEEDTVKLFERIKSVCLVS